MQNNQPTDISQLSLIICGIVRDCAGGIRRNRSTIDRLCSMVKEAKVVIFENDSKDATKSLLDQWSKECQYIYVQSEDFNTVTIPTVQAANGVNPAFSAKRINKMAYYRNKYLDFVRKQGWTADYLMVVDLDLLKIDLDGMLHSLRLSDSWDLVAANGVIYSPSAFFRRRYNDTYALVENGEENVPQTEKSIRDKQYKWAHLKKNMPLQPVYSAFGGLAIYRFQAIKDCEYTVLPNDDARVEVKCEHFALCRQMREKGFDRVYINPAMKVVYTSYWVDRILKLLCR